MPEPAARVCRPPAGHAGTGHRHAAAGCGVVAGARWPGASCHPDCARRSGAGHTCSAEPQLPTPWLTPRPPCHLHPQDHAHTHTHTHNCTPQPLPTQFAIAIHMSSRPSYSIFILVVEVIGEQSPLPSPPPWLLAARQALKLPRPGPLRTPLGRAGMGRGAARDAAAAAACSEGCCPRGSLAPTHHGQLSRCISGPDLTSPCGPLASQA